MKENRKQKTAVFLVGTLFLVVFLGWGHSFRQMLHEGSVISPVYAEDDEDERDDEGERGTNDSTATTGETTVEKAKPVYKTVYVTKVITTLDPKFTRDIDGDGIVDGLDPHPTIPEKDFFTDDDNDGVPNAFDKHKEEDDYAYFEQDDDTNKDGILDSFGSLGSN